MDKATTNISKFATMLRAVLYETRIYGRSEWSEILDVSAFVITQWINDEALPQPHNLRSLWTTLLEDTRIKNEALEAFRSIISQPSKDVSPLGEEMGLTIAHYMIRPIRKSALTTLDTLSPHLQELALLDLAKRCRELQQAGQEEPTIQEMRHFSRFSGLMH